MMLSVHQALNSLRCESFHFKGDETEAGEDMYLALGHTVNISQN